MRRTYYEDLGIPSRASRKAIEMAFWRWQGRRLAGQPEADARRRAEEAYMTLADPEKRRDYDRLLGLESHPAWTPSSPHRARASFERAEEMIKRGRNRRAVALLRRAVALDPGSATYRSHLGLLVARTGGSLREAAAHCRRAYEESPHERAIALNFAMICEMNGLHRRASGLRRRAKCLSWSPPCPPRR
jgi:Flp pilus assembly protein TadD